MKKSILLIVIILSQTSIYAQGCLPEGITFTTQEQIDNFQANYPECTEIEGSVFIYGYDISNVNGLSCLTAIEGALEILDTYGLNSLTGLEYLTHIGGDFNLIANESLINLTGMDGLTSVGGDVFINGNQLNSLTGLEGLTSIGGDLKIIANPIFTFTGLEGLNTIGGNLSILYNYIGALTGLEGITSIGGQIEIAGNNNLTSLTGLDNVQSGSIINLRIIENPVLTECNIQSLCNYLSAPNGKVEIYNNGIGCRNAGEIAISCGFQMPCLPYGDYYFTCQEDINNFQTNFPGCTELIGKIIINDYLAGNITNLYGLSNLNIQDITYLEIKYNSNLSDCDINTICQYLTLPNSNIIIFQNAPGCNSLTEVEEHCLTGIEENQSSVLSIIPNPGKDWITVTVPSIGNNLIEVFNTSGKKIIEMHITESKPKLTLALCHGEFIS